MLLSLDAKKKNYGKNSHAYVIEWIHDYLKTIRNHLPSELASPHLGNNQNLINWLNPERWFEKLWPLLISVENPVNFLSESDFFTSSSVRKRRGEEIEGSDKMERKGFLNLELLRQKSNTYEMQDARGLSIVKWVRNFEGGVIESGLWFWSIMTEAEGRLVFATFGKCLVIDLIDCSSLILKHVELCTLHHGTLLRQRIYVHAPKMWMTFLA